MFLLFTSGPILCSGFVPKLLGDAKSKHIPPSNGRALVVC